MNETPETTMHERLHTMVLLALLCACFVAGCGGGNENRRGDGGEGRAPVEQQAPSVGEGEDTGDLPPAKAPEEDGDW